MASPRILMFTMQPNFATLSVSAGVQYVGQAAGTPAPSLSTVRFYQYQPVQDAPLAPDVPQAQGYEINNLFVNDPGGFGYDDYFFLGMALHEENGRARLSVAIAEAVFDASKYPTMKQVRFRGWEQIIVPTKPAPSNGVTNFTSWEQNGGDQPPGIAPQSRLALTDYLATLTATPVALGVNVPGAGKAFLAYADCSYHGLTFRVTAEFDFSGTALLP